MQNEQISVVSGMFQGHLHIFFNLRVTQINVESLHGTGNTMRKVSSSHINTPQNQHMYNNGKNPFFITKLL